MEYSNKCRLRITPEGKKYIKLPFNISKEEKKKILSYFKKIQNNLIKQEENFYFVINPEKISLVCSKKTALGRLSKSKKKVLVTL